MRANITKVSIIIPLYNAELFIRKCINSVLSQSFKDFEIIVVNDGSTDDSLSIAFNMSEVDKRIRIYSKGNGGASSARNYGLSRAVGNYVLFLDSDDCWSDSNMLQTLYLEMESNSSVDFILFNGCYTYARKSVRIFSDLNIDKSIDKLKKFEYQIRKGAVNISPCMRIIRKSFLVDNNITFLEGIINEDVMWSIDMVNKCRDFGVIDTLYYSYNQENSGSVTSTLNKKKIEDCIYVFEKLLSISTNMHILSFISYMYVILLFNISRIEDKEFQKLKYRYLSKYKYLFNYSLHPKVKKISIMYNYMGYRGVIFLLKIYKLLR